MKNPKISIITVVFNGVQHIEQTINSVINQQYDNLEHIIIDGGSTDGTQEIIKKYEKHLAYWVSEKDTGMYHAMNKGWRKASGELIGILNADDYYFEGTIGKVAETYKKTNSDAVHGNWTKLKYIGDKKYFREEKPNFAAMQRMMGVLHPSTFVKRTVYEALNGYNEKYKLSSDYDFVLRMYNAGYLFEYVDQSFTVFRLSGVSNSDCNSYKEGYQILRENKSKFAPLLKRAIYRCYFKKMYKGLVKKLVGLFGMNKMFNKYLEKRWI